jgi:glycosyltransferase involved in cell wall biosynthesis
MQKTLGLSMIVKNESHVIKRLLNSVAPAIDYWAIVDTGSTDGTQDIIKEFFVEKGIPGELLEIEWKDFATSRNVALNAVESKVDYGFWIDADEELVLEPSFNKQAMLAQNVDCISVKTVYGRVDYTRKNIWKTGKNFSWNGPIHELLSSPEEKTGNIAYGMHVIVRAEGSSWGNVREKYLAHAAILEPYAIETNDPRWVFYTAQSYRDASEFEKSIEWYRKRAIMTSGFYEEIFISRFMIARLSEAMGKSKQECTTLYQEAHASDPVRGEAIKSLVKMYQRLGDWENAYVYSLYGTRYHMNNPYPNRILFIDKGLYDFEMLESHSLSCYYTKRFDEGSRAYWAMRAQLEKLGREQYLGEEAWAKVLENEKWFPTPVAPQGMPQGMPQMQPMTIQRRQNSNYIPPKKKRKKK